MKTDFKTAPLLAWFSQNRRELPWRQDHEVYHVWLSEIMLQQTRVEAVKGYYARFLSQLPTIAALAACEEDRLLKLWEGLGYYSRVRNLQKAARQIMQQGGIFPQQYDAIRKLPGIGDYTAGAIASICFDQPTPAVDGNVLRVMARLCDDHRDVSAACLRKEYRTELAKYYEKGLCADLTQALMELGATVCVPNGAPKCAVCPFGEICLARKNGTALLLPVKAPKKSKKEEEKTVFVLRCGELRAVKKREKRGLLAGLWEFPNVEGQLDAAAAVRQAEAWGAVPFEIEKSVERVHIFTHIVWKLRCYYLSCREMPDCFEWVDEARFGQDVALPTAFRIFSE